MAEDHEHLEFDAQSVNEAIAAARQFHQETVTTEFEANSALAESGELEISAQCISITVSNGRVCLSLPLGIGKVCLPIPVGIPNGTAAQACLSICTKFGIPTGVKVTVSALGRVILTKKFGIC